MAVTYKNGTENAYAAYEPHTQVYYASHEGISSITNYEWLRKKYMDRSFISFSFGGKWIEDFNLIAITSGNRLQKSLYGNFEDITTSYDIIDGQFYWGTHFINNQIEFTLATDGITQIQLEEFKHWFAPGVSRELILAEHPNRSINVRLAQSPILSVIPFEQKTTVKINRLDYETSITLYKGEITLYFIADEPYWSSISNILAKKNDNQWVDNWVDANGNNVNIYNDKDALKIIAEDGIPIRDMIDPNILIGNGLSINTTYTMVGPVAAEGTGHTNGNSTNTQYAEINNINQAVNYGFIGPLIEENDSIDIEANVNGYLYYCGTAPAKTILSFTLTPILTSNYISSPVNSYVNSTVPYNKITLEYNDNIQDFKFTAPSIYLAYNQAIEIFSTMAINTAWVDIANLIKEKVHHYYARKWALMVVAYCQTISDVVTFTTKSNAPIYMSYFLQNTNGDILPASFSFNGKTGEAIGEIQCRLTMDALPSSYTWDNYGTIITLTENVGDMVKSKYLIIKERNLPDIEGKITTDTVHKFFHNVSGGLTNVGISYKYMYY